ncbi:unnamed protein product [Sphagnum balticum]
MRPFRECDEDGFVRAVSVPVIGERRQQPLGWMGPRGMICVIGYDVSSTVNVNHYQVEVWQGRKCKGPTTAENGRGRDMLLLLLLRKAKESSQLRMCLPDPHMRLTCSDQWVGAGFCKSQKCNRLLEM